MTLEIDEPNPSPLTSKSEAKPVMFSTLCPATLTGANRFRFTPSAIRPGGGEMK